MRYAVIRLENNIWHSENGDLDPQQTCNFIAQRGGELVTAVAEGQLLLLFFKHEVAQQA